MSPPTDSPATAVRVHDDRQHAGRAVRLDQAHPRLPDLGGNCDPFFVDRELADRAGLGVLEDLAGIGRRHLIQERRFGERVSHLLGCGLKDDRAGSSHDSAPHVQARMDLVDGDRPAFTYGIHGRSRGVPSHP